MADPADPREKTNFSPASRVPRRVFTAPSVLTQSSLSKASSSSQSGGQTETLFTHPSVKIVAFTATARPINRPCRCHGQCASSSEDEDAGQLPSFSQLERTIAIGALRIYRAPGSVAFLSCGSALQPILPKSQCWAINEESSRFVLQIRPPQYWRIELPINGLVDAAPAQGLRDCFDKILQFEKTACPFQRDFTVELPETPKPTVKRPWSPRTTPSSSGGTPQPVTPSLNGYLGTALYEDQDRDSFDKESHDTAIEEEVIPVKIASLHDFLEFEAQDVAASSSVDGKPAAPVGYWSAFYPDSGAFVYRNRIYKDANIFHVGEEQPGHNKAQAATKESTHSAATEDDANSEATEDDTDLAAAEDSANSAAKEITDSAAEDNTHLAAAEHNKASAAAENIDISTATEEGADSTASDTEDEIIEEIIVGPEVELHRILGIIRHLPIVVISRTYRMVTGPPRYFICWIEDLATTLVWRFGFWIWNMIGE